MSKKWKKGRKKKNYKVMETIVKHAHWLVYSLLHLMPSTYQKDSFQAIVGLFLEAQGYPLPQHTKLKSPSSLSRFLNHYSWSTLAAIRTTRKAILQQIFQHRLRKGTTLRLIIDLTTLEKCGKFLHLSTPTELSRLSDDLRDADPWVRILNGKRGLHIVVLYLDVDGWRIPWSFRVWKGKSHPSSSRLARKLLSSVPRALTQGRAVLVQADTEFGTTDLIAAVRQRSWRLVAGMPVSRTLDDGRTLKQFMQGGGKKGQLVWLKDIAEPVTVSWFWLKRSDDKKELRFVISTHPYSGTYLILLGRKRWAIEGFFKTAKHRFGLHCFGQSTKLGVYRWLLLSLLAYLLTHWAYRWSQSPELDWKAASELALFTLLPLVVFRQFVKSIEKHADIAKQFGFEVVLRHIPIWWDP
jgi:hypothetical protein